MYDFILTATDNAGVRDTHHVVAASAAEAVAQLETEGHTAIELHTDDAAAVSTKLTALETGHVTPKDMVDLRGITAWGMFFFLLKKQFASPKAVFAYVISLAVVAWILYEGPPYGILFWVLIAFSLLPFLIAFYFAFLTESRRFTQLMEASAWGQWQSVIHLAEKLKGKVPDFELDMRSAVALAMLGRDEEAQAKIEFHDGNEDVPRWMYLSRVAEFYEAIGQHETSLVYHADAYHEASDNPTVELDYAKALLENEKNLELAEQLLDSAQKKPQSDLLKMLLPYVLGLQSLCKRQYTEAQSHFQEARTRLAPLAAGEPLCRLVQDLCSAHIVIASSNGGDLETARQHIGPARKRLQALGDGRLLRRMNEAFGTDR